MAVGVWQPGEGEGGGAAEPIDQALLERLAAAGEGREAVTPALLAEQGLDGHAWLMQRPHEAWAAAEALSAQQLLALVRFFTLVEAGVPGWEAGKKSPVIPLVKLLRQRDAFTPELRQWIKAHTSNRYLPYGSAL